jgi:hypothetical protein
MTDSRNPSQQELLERIEVIEAMIRDGRRSVVYWGWTQVLWGTAYLIAIGWTELAGRPGLAWPVCMIAATLITILVAGRRRSAAPGNTLARALQGIWIALGISIFLYCVCLGASHHFNMNALIAAVEFFLGAANFATAITLQWKVQGAVGVLWWAAGISTLFVAEGLVLPILAAVTLVGMIGFGLFLGYRQSRDRRARERHA